MLNQQSAMEGMKQTNASKMQQKVICHNKGPARVIAGPGSGKTFTVIQRLNYLVHHAKVPAEHILCITFTKAAALEMQERYQIQKTVRDETGAVCFGTVHSICYHILKESGEFRQYSLIQEQQKKKLLEMLLTDNGYKDYINDTAISEILYAIGRKKNELPYREEDCLPLQQFEELYHAYKELLTERRLLDFDDMINGALLLLRSNERLRQKWQNRFSYLMVDEFQDINHAQYQFIKVLAQPQNNLLVVGDDDQAIYGFRGAAPDIMRQFSEDFPEAACLYLTENYRSSKEIVSFAGKVIQKNRIRIPKTIETKKQGGEVTLCYEETRKEEDARLLADIRKLESTVLLQSAVIVRTNMEALQYIRLLKTNAIPVRQKSQKSYENLMGHFIKADFDAFLRFCKEGRERSNFLKIMNKPEMFLSRQALVYEIVTLEEMMHFYKENPIMQAKLKQFFMHLDKAESMSFSLAIRYFRNIMGYDHYLKERSANQQEYEAFIHMADELQCLYKKQKHRESCDAFWLRIEREYQSLNEQKAQTEGISVITMHGAKGLEFQHVFLPDVNDGVIPAKQCKSKESIEEERRLLYVAVTRAKEALHIYYTKERGRKLSRFLDENM